MVLAVSPGNGRWRHRSTNGHNQNERPTRVLHKPDKLISSRHKNQTPAAPPTAHYRRVAWLNPQAQRAWGHTQSIAMVRQLMEGRMFPLTLAGLDAMTRELSR